MNRREIFVILYSTPRGVVLSYHRTYFTEEQAVLDAREFFATSDISWFIGRVVDPERKA